MGPPAPRSIGIKEDRKFRQIFCVRHLSDVIRYTNPHYRPNSGESHMWVTRRRFFYDALTLSAGAAILPRRSWGRSGSSELYGSDLFPKPDMIRYDAQCYTIGGVDTFIFSLECPYPRCAREEWRDRFVKIKQAGFNTIDTYVFWNYHEREKGRFDFSELEEFQIGRAHVL